MIEDFFAVCLKASISLSQRSLANQVLPLLVKICMTEQLIDSPRSNANWGELADEMCDPIKISFLDIVSILGRVAEAGVQNIFAKDLEGLCNQLAWSILQMFPNKMYQ